MLWTIKFLTNFWKQLNNWKIFHLIVKSWWWKKRVKMFVKDGRWDNIGKRIHCLFSLGLASLKNNFFVTMCSAVFNLLCNTISPSHRDNVFWILQAVHHEIISCVQLIVERVKKKFNATSKKINKQLGKEKKLLSMDKTKGLIKEHEVPATLLFCSPTSLCECIVYPCRSFLGTLLQPVFVEQGPCAPCYVNTEQRGHPNYFFTFFDCRY